MQSVSFPSNHEIQEALISLLNQHGGQAQAKSAYGELALALSVPPKLLRITLAEWRGRTSRYPGSDASSKWENRVQAAVEGLRKKGVIERGTPNGLWRVRHLEPWPGPATDNITAALESELAKATHDLVERHAGFQSDPKTRAIVDRHAMKLAKQWLEQEGYEQVEDMSASKPYDYACVRAGRRYFAEVKGTQTLGASVIVTANEVQHAMNAGASILVLGRSIQVEHGKATGGIVRAWGPWSPSWSAPKALQYQWKCNEPKPSEE